MLYDTFQFRVELVDHYDTNYDNYQAQGVVYLGDVEVFRTNVGNSDSRQVRVDQTMEVFANHLKAGLTPMYVINAND